jgi:phosphatidate cytidylyltransferase
MVDTIDGWIARVPPIDWALALAVLFALLLSLAYGRRGGRHRLLPGWGLFWVGLAALLVCLSRANYWVSFPVLAVVMFAALRTYFFVVPVRPRDRWAILAAYLSIPFALWPAFRGSTDTFLATVPIVLFLVIPVLLSFGSKQGGLLDSTRRTLIGVLFFVFCIAHLGLLVHQELSGMLELFGVLVLAAELPQRFIVYVKSERSWLKSVLGNLFSLVLAIGTGHWLGPWCGLIEEDAARAGGLVALAVIMGSLVSHAVSEDLAVDPASAGFGRGAMVTRMIPPVYAALVFFHYLNHFA